MPTSITTKTKRNNQKNDTLIIRKEGNNIGKVSSSAEKRVRTRNKGLTAQNKKDLECILGICNHTITSKTCLYWNKVVDADDPAGAQYKLIIKLIGG